MSVPTSSYSFTDTGITHSASSSSPSAAITETATTSVEVTVTNTLTLTLLAHGSVKYSLIFPSPPSKTSASGTTTILEMATTVATTIPPPSDHLAPSPSTTERSTLCFDATVGSNVPCPLPPTSPPATQTTVVAEMLSDAPLFTFAGWLERLLTVLIMNAIAYAYDTLVGW